MIPSFRSIADLMALARPRPKYLDSNHMNESISLVEESGQKKRCIRESNETVSSLPDLPADAKNKWKKKENIVSKFLDDLDYNNQIQNTLDLTLLESQNRNNHLDAV